MLKIERELDRPRFTAPISAQDMMLHGNVDASDSRRFATFTRMPADFLSDPATEHTRAWEEQQMSNQERRLSSLDGAAISWVAGRSWLHTEYGAAPPRPC